MPNKTWEERFNDEFVTPTDSNMRAMDLSGEPCLIGTAKAMKQFIKEEKERDREELVKSLPKHIVQNPYVDEKLVEERGLQTSDVIGYNKALKEVIEVINKIK